MEGASTVTKALKTSCWPEMNLKGGCETVSDDVWVENVIPGDDFFVDDLLDFSKDEVFNEEQEEEKDFLSVSSHEEENQNNGVCVKDEFSELSVPADDLEQLEWLSHFVEDSFSVPYPKQGNPLGSSTTKTVKPEPLSLSEISETEPISEKPQKPEIIPLTPFPARARSKRSRTGVRVWSLGGSSSSLGDTSGSSESSISSGSSASASTSCLIFSNPTPNVEFFYHYDEDYKPPSKKPKKKRALTERSHHHHHSGGGHGGMTGFLQQQQRRCSHCGVQKTPQWRTGPEGAKTLCNACGVRYKSGRLLPEYRPACSPTFSSEVHSNSHRKVLEMRRKKEVVPPQQTGFAPRVQSF
ncbi:hypothetical protein ACHQM5_015480 [Ranunculus cassubicifolius]